MILYYTFHSKIENSAVETNWDTPEAGFDGLMQVKYNTLLSWGIEVRMN